MTEGVVEVCQSSQTTSGGETRDQPCASIPANTDERPANSTQPPSCSSTSERKATLYSSVTTSVLSEFVPSRPTRQSTNKALQNEVSDVRIAMRQRGLAAKHKTNWLPESSRPPAVASDALLGEYADLDFIVSAVKQEGTRLGGQEMNRVRRDQLMSVYGLERSAVYENLVRPRDGLQASFWVGADHKGIPSEPDSNQCSPEPEPDSASRSESPHGVDLPSNTGAGEELVPTATLAPHAAASRSVSCDSSASVRSSECDDDGGSDRHGGPGVSDPPPPPPSAAAASLRSQSLHYPRRMSSRRRCVTPVLTTRAPPSPGCGSADHRRHYEETDLVTGLPFEMSPPMSPSRPGSPQIIDIAALQELSYVHTRSSSAPEGVPSSLADDDSLPSSAQHPVSPLAQDQVFGTTPCGNGGVTKVTYGAGPPRPPLRRSSLSVKSQSSEALAQLSPSSSSPSRRRVRMFPDGTPPLPPKNQRRRGSITTTQDQSSDSSHATPGGAGDGARRGGGHSPDLSSPAREREHCDSPASVVMDASTCSSPELINVGTLPCRTSWRKSSALDVFGEFPLVFLGQLDVDVAYGAVNGVMEAVVQRSAAAAGNGDSPTPCCLTVTASTLQVSNSAGVLFAHEVDSVETIAAYSGKSLSSADGGSGREDCQNVLSYVMVQEGVAATCFVFRAKKVVDCSAVVSTIETALYADVKQFKSMTYPRHVMMRGSAVGHAGQFSVKHIGSIAVQSAYNSVDEAGKQILSHTNPAKVQFSFMDLDADRIRLRTTTSNVIYASHQSHAVTSVGSFGEDCRVFGYVVRQRSSALPHMCHIFRCSRPATALAIIECIKDICQESYMSRLKSKEGQDSSDEERSNSGTGRGIRSFFSRSRKSAPRSLAESKSSEKPKPASLPEVEACIDVSRLRSESTDNMVIIELTESPTLRRVGSAADDPAHGTDTSLDFCLDYLGTGSLLYNEQRPKDMTKQVLQDFARNGKEAGAVDCGKVKVSARVSSQGVTLTDTEHAMFVKRHYPRRALFHVDQHDVDRQLLSFATLPPSLSSIRHSPVGRTAIKVHVFRCTAMPAASVAGALRGIMHRFPA